MNRKLMTAALALALGLAWTASPAMAQSTTEKMKDKAETAKDKVEEKATDIKDKIKDTTVDLKDKVTSKMHRTSKAENPDVYPLGFGLQKISTKDYKPINELKALKSAKPPEKKAQ